MNSIKTLYKLMEVSSRDLEIPDAYQRKLNTERVAKIVAGFNERIAINGSSSMLPMTRLYSSQILSSASGVSYGASGVKSVSVSSILSL